MKTTRTILILLAFAGLFCGVKGQPMPPLLSVTQHRHMKPAALIKGATLQMTKTVVVAPIPTQTFLITVTPPAFVGVSTDLVTWGTPFLPVTNSFSVTNDSPRKFIRAQAGVMIWCSEMTNALTYKFYLSRIQGDYTAAHVYFSPTNGTIIPVPFMTNWMVATWVSTNGNESGASPETNWIASSSFLTIKKN